MSADLAGRVPGLTILALVALGAALVAGPLGLNALVVAILFGALLANAVGVPAALRPGFALSTLFLETALVLLGASVPLDALVTAGPRVLALVVVAVAAGLVVTRFAARAAGTTERVGALLAAGASVGGVAAVAAAADALDADEADVAPVVAAVLLVDIVALVAVPLVGAALGLPARQFGVWAGLALLSTGPAVAAGFVYAPLAGQWAAVTRLLRDSLLGGVALAYAASRTDREGASPGRLRTAFPPVLVGFLGVLLVANSGLLAPGSLDLLVAVTDWLFLLAFAGLGFELRLARAQEAGRTLVAVALVHLVAVGALALLAVVALGL